MSFVVGLGERVFQRSVFGRVVELLKSGASENVRCCTPTVACFCLHKTSLASREERSHIIDVGVWVVLVEGPLLPGAFGLVFPNVIHFEGPSVMADLIDRTLVITYLHGWRL